MLNFELYSFCGHSFDHHVICTCDTQIVDLGNIFEAHLTFGISELAKGRSCSMSNGNADLPACLFAANDYCVQET